jgi:outer membrane protein
MKQFLLFTALIVGSLTFAQAQKFGHVDAQDILLNLPERADAQAEIEMQAAQYEQEMLRMQEDLQTRFADYQANQESWPAAIREQKERELQALDQGLQEFGATVQNELAGAEQKLLLPMIERVRQAIEEVGAENGFTYLFDTSSGGTVFNGGEDVSAKVKAKLGM